MDTTKEFLFVATAKQLPQKKMWEYSSFPIHILLFDYYSHCGFSVLLGLNFTRASRVRVFLSSYLFIYFPESLTTCAPKFILSSSLAPWLWG